MKIVCISDTHNLHCHLKLPPGDVLVHAGDATLTGELHEMIDFRDWFESQDYSYRVMIGGNHDVTLGNAGKLIGPKMFSNSYYLENSGVEIEGLQFWGSPMTPAFKGMRRGLTFYTTSAKEAINIWKGIPDDTDVLITHGPPYGILDKAYSGLLYESGFSCGDLMLGYRVSQVKPKLHIFGHIHEEGGKVFDSYIGVKYVNCSVVNRAYNLINKPVVVDI